MGLMDKVKQQAENALHKAQEGVNQGQAKLDQVQAKRQAEALLRNLGAAYYAQQRDGGHDEAVAAAVKALDEQVAAHGLDLGADDGAAATTAPPAEPATAEAATAEPASSGIPASGPAAPPVG